MRAVNQSIGRAIRHANDYAAIVLVDERWARAEGAGGGVPPSARLPGWIRARMSPAQSFGEAYTKLHRFFKERRAAST
eukprot:913553-Prorocentrum_minimum.AAC.3